MPVLCAAVAGERPGLDQGRVLVSFRVKDHR